MRIPTRSVALAGALAIIAASGCDNGPSAVETRDRATTEAPVALAAVPASAAEAAPAEAPAVLTANRRETVDAKITRLYERNGAAFGARWPEDYLARIKAFTGAPPAGTERVSRPNGDVLFYQAATNTFAVVARNGTPRTMFKPDDGPGYWAEQKARAPTFGQRRAASD